MKFRIVIDGKTYEVEYDDGKGPASPSSPTVSERIQSLVLPTPHADEARSEIDEAKLCRSPVAGIVTSINVTPGQLVNEGDVVVVVEAMKMENHLRAARAARVGSVKTKAREAVKPGQILIEFE